MSDELRDAIKDSIDDSLVQLGRGSGIATEHRARMVEIIARPLFFLIEDANASLRASNAAMLAALEAAQDALLDRPEALAVVATAIGGRA